MYVPMKLFFLFYECKVTAFPAKGKISGAENRRKGRIFDLHQPVVCAHNDFGGNMSPAAEARLTETKPGGRAGRKVKGRSPFSRP